MNMGAIRLSVAVMTHPARLEQARRLAQELDDVPVTIACDPAPGQGPATLRSARLAWHAAAADSTHHLVLQDDVQVRSNFMTRVREAIAQHPEQALAFFAEWGSATATAMRIAALRGCAWAPVTDHYVPTQALAMPVAVARQVEPYLARLPLTTPDDHALRDLLLDHGIQVLVAVPNLVQHADAPSLIGNESMGLRRAACYEPSLAEEGVPVGPVLDWPTGLPYFSWWDRAATFRVWDRPGTANWRNVALDDFFAAAQMPPDLLAGMRSTSIDRLLSGGTVPVSQPALVDLWSTSFAIGLLAAQGAGAQAYRSTWSRSAAVALHSLAPGALRLLASAGELFACADRMAAFVLDAVRAGAAFKAPDALPTRYLRALRPTDAAR